MSEKEIIRREILRAIDNYGAPINRKELERQVHCSLRNMNRERWPVEDPITRDLNEEVCMKIYEQIDLMLKER